MNPNKLTENQCVYRFNSYSNDLNKRQQSALQSQPFFMLDSDKAYAMSLPNITHHQHHQLHANHQQPQTQHIPHHMSHSLSNSSFKDSMLSLSSMSLSSSCSSLLNSSSSLNSTWSSVLYLPSLHPHLFSEPNYVNTNTQTAASATPSPQTAANSKRETFYENFFTNLNANGNFNKNHQLNNAYGLMNGANSNISNSGNGKMQQLRRVQNSFGPQIDSKLLMTANASWGKSENEPSEFSISFEEINRKVNDLINSNADDIKFSEKKSFVSSSSSSSSSSPSPSMDDEREEYMNNKEVSDLSSNMNLSDTESNCNESNLSDSSSKLTFLFIWRLNVERSFNGFVGTFKK